MNKVLLAIILVGIALVVIGLVQIAVKGQVKLIGETIVEDTIKFDNKDATILSFNTTKERYKLRVEIDPIIAAFGGIEVKPLVFAMLVDDEGLKDILNNKTASHMYLVIEGLDKKDTFTINDISGAKRLHMLFSTPLPEQEAKVTIIMIYNKIAEPISSLDVGLFIGGVSMITGSLALRKHIKKIL